MSHVSVADVERSIARAFPPEWAEPWDRVGLLAGDPAAEVRGVLLALDPTLAAIAVASTGGANLLVTHHPVFLDPPSALRPGAGAGGALFAAVQGGVALLNAHTNLDRAPRAGSLLPARLGLVPVTAIERTPQPMTLVTVFVPEDAVRRVTDAMAGAGAGRIGQYEGCSFAAAGTGAFTAPADASPAVGTPGQDTHAPEARVEMVAPRARASSVIAAARGAHPYEEPLIVTADVTIARNAARLGMLSAVPGGATTLGELATRAASSFGVAPRVWGDESLSVERVATATGSAGSLVDAALAVDAHVLVAGEVRYHDALEAVEAGLAIIELGHDVSEWPLVDLLADAVRATPGLDARIVTVAPATYGWWTPRRDT